MNTSLPIAAARAATTSSVASSLVSDKAAPAVAGTRQRLALAESLLLEPFGLTRSHLQQALAVMHARGVDDADLYFQSTHSEGWSLEEGIVKTGSFSIDQGVGLRAISGEKTAFAYSDDISWAALMDAANQVRSIGSSGQSGRVRVGRQKQAQPPAPARARVAPSRSLYAAFNPIGTLDSAAKVALLEKVEKMARAKDPRIVQVMAGLGAEYDVVLVVRLDGTLAADVRPMVRMSLTVIAEQMVEGEARREVGSSGGGGRLGLDYFDDALLQQYVDEAVEAALINLESRPAPAGEMDVVLGAGWPGVLLHEAVGHGWRATSTAKAAAPLPGAWGSAWRPKALPCWMTAPWPTAAAA